MKGKRLRQAAQLVHQHLAHGGRIVDQAEPVDLAEHGKTRRAGQRIAGIGVAVLEAAAVEHRLDDAASAPPCAPSGA